MTWLSPFLAAARRRAPSGEDGVSLLFVLIFMILVMVMIFGSITFAGTSLQASAVVKDVRQQQYAADAGIEMAIQKVANDPSGILGSPTSTGACSFKFTNLNGRTVTVSCSPSDSTAGGWRPGRPRNALLTLDPNNALQITGSAQSVNVGGNVYISSYATFDHNSSMTVDHGVYRQVQGPPSATCPASGTGLNLVNGSSEICPDGVDGADWGADPKWTQLPVTGSASVTCSNGTASFTPGMLTKSPVAMLGSGACTNIRTLYFSPGAYGLADGVTFDQNGDGTARQVVGGTPVSGWIPTSGGPPAGKLACNPSLLGVQFVLYGSASIAPTPIHGSGMTLCAGPTAQDASQPAIAIYASEKTAPQKGVVRISTDDRKCSPPQPLTCGDKNMSIYIDGEVYAPTSNVNLQLHGQLKAKFVGGAVLFGGSLDVTGFQQTDSVFGLPSCSMINKCRYDRDLVFTASVDGHKWTTSEVHFDDQGGVYPATSTTVKTWSVMP